MKIKPTRRSALMGLVAVIACVGCGSSQPSTYPVTGTVTYQGKAVEGATVGFSATDPETRGAIGKTDSEGKYMLTTFAKDDGALPGDFKVRVLKYDREPAVIVMSEKAETIDEMPEDYEPEEGVDQSAPPKHVLPEKYASPNTTPLTFTVEAKENTFDIALE